MTIPAVLGERRNTDSSTDPGRRIASVWHTLLLIAILLAIAARGAMFQRGAGEIAPSRNVLPLYAALVLSEVALLFGVWQGIRGAGLGLADLVGGRWRTANDVARDVAFGALAWILLAGVSIAWSRIAPESAGVRSISPMLPHGVVETTIWIAVSIAAGIAEEITFRGYLQRQFTSITKHAWAGIAIQAILFGVSHGYQGWNACVKITLIGAVFGAFAWWRRSLRPTIIAHAWTDIVGGIVR